MPRQLLDEALEQAHVSAPSVRAMALLHIARVLTAVDRAEARRTLDHALRESDGRRNFATELQGIYLEGLLEAIIQAITRIKRSDA